MGRVELEVRRASEIESLPMTNFFTIPCQNGAWQKTRTTRIGPALLPLIYPLKIRTDNGRVMPTIGMSGMAANPSPLTATSIRNS